MANWKYNAVQDLKEYEAIKDSMLSIPEEIKAIEIDMQVVKGVSYDKTPVSGGASGREDRLIDYIDRKGRVQENYKAAELRVRRIERGLNCLTEKERKVLERFFINREYGHIDRLCDDLGYEKSAVYKLKDTALKKFTLSMFGVVDL